MCIAVWGNALQRQGMKGQGLGSTGLTNKKANLANKERTATPIA